MVGEHVATYADLGFEQPVFGLDFHPFDNMIAFSTYGANSPIMVYTYDLTRAHIHNLLLHVEFPLRLLPTVRAPKALRL